MTQLQVATAMKSPLAPPSSSSSSSSSAAAASSSSNVRVVGRIRPLAKYEKEKGCQQVVTTEPGDPDAASEIIRIQSPDKRHFELDAVFDETSTQLDCYRRSGAQNAVCEDLFRGFNCTILAYGQTGAGKTFTMGTAASSSDADGNSAIGEHDGVIPRACHDLYATISSKCDGNATVELSYMEVYNEEIRDLLTENTNTASMLRIRENMNGEVYVRGLTSQKVSSPADIGRVMEEASKRRVVASTKMNATSSRSHAICTLRMDGVLKDSSKFQSKLTLVDLAGSERIKKTGAAGNRAQEGININKGLFVLGQVVSALSEQRPRFKRKPPYRDSKLTRLLQDSLGGNSRTIMIACASPADFNVDETINTLRYATSARNIKNKATRNVMKTLSPEEAAKLQRENQLLKNQVTELQSTIKQLEDQLVAQVSSSDSSDGEEDDADGGVNKNDAACGDGGDDESMQLSEINEDKIKIEELEKENKGLRRNLKRVNGDIRESLHETAIELPAMKVQMALLEDELEASQSLNDGIDDLHDELSQARAEAKAAKAVASHLTKILESNQESSTHLSSDRLSISSVPHTFPNQHEMEVEWVSFVNMVMGTFQENMRQLGDYFDMVSKIVDSPEIIKMLPKRSSDALQRNANNGPGTPQRKRWWGSNQSVTAANQLVEGLKEEMELRQKLLTEHIKFYQERFLEIEDTITGRAEVVDAILDSLRQGSKRELGILPELTALLIDVT
eukprot:CAMPEP_0119549968 /NCGR_PEP_ID=MMETSP1352-20130426/3585_1 /TAXON_ID=265584 /ORGANISM="Stauroneis constricta, Strain CCMP1120" /LENGTH=733 /DNA_ID=CAMNT_0007595699 /DNA_START=219 /DNA_END=2423 /DNA_ORIENTATION=-